eukprot:gene8335-5842_t
MSLCSIHTQHFKYIYTLYYIYIYIYFLSIISSFFVIIIIIISIIIIIIMLIMLIMIIIFWYGAETKTTTNRTIQWILAGVLTRPFFETQILLMDSVLPDSVCLRFNNDNNSIIRETKTLEMLARIYHSRNSHEESNNEDAIPQDNCKDTSGYFVTSGDVRSHWKDTRGRLTQNQMEEIIESPALSTEHITKNLAETPRKFPDSKVSKVKLFSDSEAKEHFTLIQQSLRACSIDDAEQGETISLNSLRERRTTFFSIIFGTHKSHLPLPPYLSEMNVSQLSTSDYESLIHKYYLILFEVMLTAPDCYLALLPLKRKDKQQLYEGNNSSSGNQLDQKFNSFYFSLSDFFFDLLTTLSHTNGFLFYNATRSLSLPWKSSLPPSDDIKWSRLGKSIVDTAVSNDTGKTAFEECRVCRDQLEVVIQSLGYDMNVFIFGGLVTLGLLEIGGDIDFVGVSDTEPNFEEAGEIVSKVARELKRMGVRAWALPKARVPVIKADRTSKSFPGSPFHQLSRDGIFHFARCMSPTETASFDKILHSDYSAKQVEWNSSNQYAIVQFETTSALINALSFVKKHEMVDIPIRLPIDPKSGPEIFRFPFDFCLSPTGLRNSYLFAESLAEYECARHLLITLKKWGRSSGIINSIDGLLASYALTVMLVHYLVQVNVINKVQPDRVSDSQGLQTSPEYRPLCHSNDCDLGKVGFLLAGFFEYYGYVFDYSKSVVCTTNTNMTKEILHWNKEVCDYRPPFFEFAIKDPYGLDNIARNLDADSTSYVRDAHAKAFQATLAGLSDPKSLLHLLVQSPPKPTRKTKTLFERGIVSDTLSPSQMEAKHVLSKIKFHERKREIESLGRMAAKNSEDQNVASVVTKNVLGWIRNDRKDDGALVASQYYGASYDERIWARGDPLKHGTRHFREESSLPWDSAHEVIPRLFLSCESQAENRCLLIEKGITLVINLCAATYQSKYKFYTLLDGKLSVNQVSEVSNFISLLHAYNTRPSPPSSERRLFLCSIAADDIPTYDLGQHFMECSYLIDHVLRCGSRQRLTAPSVFVHCLVGVSRSASVVVAYLMKRWRISVAEAVSFVKRVRAVIQPNPGFIQALQLWEQCKYLRTPDELSATRAGREIMEEDNEGGRRPMQEYVYRLLLTPKMSADREFVAFTINQVCTANDSAVNALRHVFCRAVREEMHVDAPLIFKHMCEIIDGMSRRGSFHKEYIFQALLCTLMGFFGQIDAISMETALRSLLAAMRHSLGGTQFPIPFVPFLVPIAVERFLYDRSVEETEVEKARGEMTPEDVFHGSLDYFTKLTSDPSNLSSFGDDVEIKVLLACAAHPDVSDVNLQTVMTNAVAEEGDATVGTDLTVAQRKMASALVGLRLLLEISDAKAPRRAGRPLADERFPLEAMFHQLQAMAMSREGGVDAAEAVPPHHLLDGFLRDALTCLTTVRCVSTDSAVLRESVPYEYIHPTRLYTKYPIGADDPNSCFPGFIDGTVQPAPFTSRDVQNSILITFISPFFRTNFDFFDYDKMMRVQVSDIPALVRICGAVPLEQDMEKIKAVADPNGRGAVNFEDFCKALRVAFDCTIGQTDVKKAFYRFDPDKRGLISQHELRYIMTTLGDPLTLDEMNEMIEEMRSEMDMEGNFSDCGDEVVRRDRTTELENNNLLQIYSCGTCSPSTCACADVRSPVIRLSFIAFFFLFFSFRLQVSECCLDLPSTEQPLGAMSSNPILLEDTFVVTKINSEGAVYLRVSRIECVSEDGELTVISDINTEQFPVKLDERLTIMLASSIELGGQSEGSKSYDHSIYHRPTRLNECDYAMHGLVYGHEVEEHSLKVAVHISCGGLLTRVEGKPNSLRDIHYNDELFLLMEGSQTSYCTFTPRSMKEKAWSRAGRLHMTY